MARIPLKDQVTDLKMRIAHLEDENAYMKAVIENSNQVDFDFDYSVAVAIKRSYGDTIISCMPNKISGEIKEFRFVCSVERHAELVAEFARYKTKPK